MLKLFRRPSAPPEPAAPPRVAEDERVYAIGDIHGRADLLDDLLRRIVTDAQTHSDGRRVTIVFLGDYIDRGENSAQVLERLMRLHDKGAVCLMGNHEASLLDFVDDPVAASRWLDFGGLQTLASYGVPLPTGRDRAQLHNAALTLGARMGPHLGFLRNALLPHHESGDVVFVHAALAPNRPLPAQREDVILWGDEAFLRTGWRADRLAVHGHYASNDVVSAPGRVCIDTGAFYSGVLTAARLDLDISFISTRASNTRTKQFRLHD